MYMKSMRAEQEMWGWSSIRNHMQMALYIGKERKRLVFLVPSFQVLTHPGIFLFTSCVRFEGPFSKAVGHTAFNSIQKGPKLI